MSYPLERLLGSVSWRSAPRRFIMPANGRSRCIAEVQINKISGADWIGRMAERHKADCRCSAAPVWRSTTDFYGIWPPLTAWTGMPARWQFRQFRQFKKQPI